MTPPEKRPFSSQAGLEMRDIDLDSVPLGPASYMALVEADDSGRLNYKVGSRAIQSIPLGKEHAGSTFSIIDTLRVTMICDPKTNELVGIAGHPLGQLRVVYFGVLSGYWADETGRRQLVEDPLAYMRGLRLPVVVNSDQGEVTLDFYVNIYNREAFTSETRRLFQEGAYRYSISLTFAAPSGDYVRGMIYMQNAESGVKMAGYDVKQFPLIWPSSTVAARRPEPAREQPNAAPPRQKFNFQPASERTESSAGGATHRARLRPRQAETGEAAAGGPPPRAKLRPSGASESASSSSYAFRPAGATPTPIPPQRRSAPEQADQAEKKKIPIPKTEHLPVEELLQVARAEHDLDRRWKIIESNLMLGRPERTYSLVANFSENIGERSAAWPPLRLKTVFKELPGSVLIGIMEHWCTNQVMLLAEGNTESEKIMQWLREREVDRLLRLSLEKEPATLDDARADLNVDKNADAAMVKKVWRTLLGFLNADLGRVDERAIHRKKDEIAKHLQIARNVLLKKLPIG